VRYVIYIRVYIYDVIRLRVNFLRMRRISDEYFEKLGPYVRFSTFFANILQFMRSYREIRYSQTGNR
jgi:hypothetical protein